MKQTITLLACVALLFGACQNKEEKTETETVTKEITVEKPEEDVDAVEKEMCFMQVVSKDTLLLTITRDGDNISGTYKSIPFEKDKKTNVFKGNISGNTVNAIGTAMAEGTTVQEEIVFTIENNQAGLKFGEMIEGDDGVYRYKNVKSATSLFINKVACP